MPADAFLANDRIAIGNPRLIISPDPADEPGQFVPLLAVAIREEGHEQRQKEEATPASHKPVSFTP
jgi:hypothetical protein